MDYQYIPGRALRYFAKAGYFFLFLLLIYSFYGCAPVEKLPQEDTFLHDRAMLIRERGDIAYVEGDYQRALLSFRDALVIDRRLNDQGREITDLIGMGRAYTGLGRMELAGKNLMKAVRLAFSSRDDKGLARAYTALARNYLRANIYDRAIENINDAISLTQAGGGATLGPYTLAARIYLRAGRLDDAEAMIDKALSEVSREGAVPSFEISDTYRVKAGILSKKGDSASAISYFDKAYAVDARQGDEKNMALDLWSSAVVLMDLGRYKEAITHLKRSFLLYRKSGSIKGAMRDIDKLVEIYIAIGDKSSESYYRNMREAMTADMR